MRISSLSRILNHARASGFLQEAQSADGTEQGEEEEGDAEMKEKEEEEEAEGEKEVEEEEEEEEESSSSEEDGSELGATPGYEIVAPHPHVGGGLNGFNVGIGRIEGLDSLRAAEDPAPGPQGGASGSGRAPLPVVPDVHAGRDESGSGSDERYSMGMGGASEEEEEEEVCVNCAQPMSSCRGSICADHHSLAAGDLFGEDAADMDPLPRSGFEGRAIARRITGEAARAPPTPRGTALAYDERMNLHCPLQGDCHPERPHRIAAIYHHLVRQGLAARCVQLTGTECTEEEATTVHTQRHWAQVQAVCDEGSRSIGGDTYANEATAMCARLSAGTVLDVCRRVLRGEVCNGAAVVRPPGHHAEREVVMGFCFFNYVAAAAAVAKSEFGLKRVLILDWDVHHGNGTEKMFINDPSVLYISLHRYDDGSFYPGTGPAEEVGVREGAGYNVNIPWPHSGMGDAEYLLAFERVVMPIARSYNPELVLVSAGFDAAHGDPLGGCNVTPYGYGQMTNMLRGLAGGRMVVALEGGYNLRSISRSMEAVVRVLLGDAPPEVQVPEGEEIEEEVQEVGKYRAMVPRAAGVALAKVIAIQQRFWPVLRGIPHFQPEEPSRSAGEGDGGGAGSGSHSSDEAGPLTGKIRKREKMKVAKFGARLPGLRVWLARGGGRRGVWKFLSRKKR